MEFENIAAAWTGLPPWLTAAALLTCGLGLGLLAARVTNTMLVRVTRSGGLFPRALVQRTRGPRRLAFLVGGLLAAMAVAPLSDGFRALLGHLILLGLIGLAGWAAVAALHVSMVVYSRRFKIDVEDNLIARKHLTQVRILERTATALIVILCVAWGLMTFEPVRQYGVTILASAGAAGIIAGFALQPLLVNLIAGVQIAITQPIRIDDAVIVEGEWGWVEEIGSTYVVVKLWDWRRLVLPLSYFIQNPFQNWTRQSASLIGTAMIYVDYSAPVDAMRRKLEEIVRGSALWDGDVVNLAVTDLTERTMQVRCLASARNAAMAFDLRCEIREQMIGFLRQVHPEALPTDRLAWEPEIRGESKSRRTNASAE
jgi:small-conductance mechanosensitive channel